MPMGMGYGDFGFIDLFNTLGGFQININTASKEVIQMLPGMDPNLAWEVTMTRAGFDGMEGTEDDMPFMRITDLMNVPGMTPDLMSLMRSFVTNRSNTFEIFVEARIDEYVKMFAAGIIDPAKVARVAVENAASIAGMVLTTEAAITEIPEDEKMPPMPDPGMGGMGGMGGMM